MASPLRIGVLIVPPIQLLDLSPIDLFGMLTPDYIAACEFPKPLASLSVPIEFFYISREGAKSLAALTSNIHIHITNGVEDAEVAPGTLDILFVPGPDPRIVPDEETLQFVRDHVDKGVTLMTVCTGIFVAAYSGMLDGRRATGPRALIDMVLKKKFPKVIWEDQRWSVDGNIWTGGGITNGQEMVAHYIKKRWPGPISDTVCAMADVGDKGQDYVKGKTADKAWWVFLMMRAFFGGLFRSKPANATPSPKQ